ncbi:MAG: O-antigen ligase family protein [Sphingorhabdus sp.]
MLEAIPYVIAGIALLAAVAKLPGLDQLRWTAVLLGLGAGQIYIAVASFLLFLLIENNLAISVKKLRKPLYICAVFFVSIAVLTFFSGYTLRSISEMGQLFIYIAAYILLCENLKTEENVLLFLKACAFAGFIVTVMAITTVVLGIQTPPYIFIDRGSNEGAAFIGLIGVVSATSLFIMRRNPTYLIMGVTHIYASFLATSRGGLVISALAFLAGFFFLTKSIVLRSAMIAGGIYILMLNIPQIQFAIEEQVNFSTKERILLVQHGWDIAQERFWTGWGWGSTNVIAERVPTAIVYPHFHNAYIQLLVELGFLGWVLTGLFLYFVASRSYAAFTQIRSSTVSTLVVGGSLGLIVSGFFDAMLFGADRALQVVIVMALIAQSVKIGKDQRQKTSRLVR